MQTGVRLRHGDSWDYCGDVCSPCLCPQPTASPLKFSVPPCQSRTKHQWGLNQSASSCSALIMYDSETQQHLRNSQRIKHPKTPTATEAKLPAEEHSRSQGVRACIFRKPEYCIIECCQNRGRWVKIKQKGWVPKNLTCSH